MLFYIKNQQNVKIYIFKIKLKFNVRFLAYYKKIYLKSVFILFYFC